jgi:hypothetical protein
VGSLWLQHRLPAAAACCLLLIYLSSERAKCSFADANACEKVCKSKQQ